MKYNKEYLTNYLKNIAIKNNKINISKKDIDKLNGPSSATFKRYFGSWKNAIDAANLKTGIISGRNPDPPIYIPPNCMEIINGELLGDGSIYLSGSYKTNACFCHSTANFSYGKYLYKKLENDIPLLGAEILKARGGNKQFRTRTTTNVSWTEIYKKWYINNKKIVPENIKLTKETCLHWYLGDGYFEDKTSKISTCGFTKDEIDKLSKALTNLGFKAAANKRSGGYYVIRFSKYYYKDFLNWIGNCPVNGYEHRWGIINEKEKK